jgi:hypothetical protein
MVLKKQKILSFREKWGMDLAIVLATIGIFLLVAGILYAVVIYRWSMDRTYFEVIIGVGITIIGEIMATAAVLIKYELLEELWWILLFSPIAFILTGVPMALAQEYKHWQQQQKAENAELKYNGEKR